MPLNYSPKDAVMCWPESEYDAVLEKVEDKISKAGNDMQAWTWKVHNDDGRTQLITDYVAIPAATFKIKQLAKALGLEEEFKAEKFQADDHVGCTVKADLVIEQQEGFDDKNKIGRIKARESASNGQQQPYPRTRESVVAGRGPAPASLSTEETDMSDVPF